MLKKIYPFLQLMRLDKPIGILLALWPTLWALWFANAGIPSIKLLIIFIAGTIIMRSAGCVINDIIDKHIDKHVKRTHMRPLAQGVLSVKEAQITFFILMLLALLLVLQLNTLSIQLACVIAALTAFYPLTKRFFKAPQLVLSLPFNAGVLLAYSASLNMIPLSAWILFLISMIWTLAYDTLYAMVDKSDDMKLGLQSTAILFGRYNAIITVFLYMIFFIGLFLMGVPIIFLGAAILWTVYFLWQTQSHTESAYFRAFLANNITGLLIFLGIFFAYL